MKAFHMEHKWNKYEGMEISTVWDPEWNFDNNDMEKFWGGEPGEEWWCFEYKYCEVGAALMGCEVVEVKSVGWCKVLGSGWCEWWVVQEGKCEVRGVVGYFDCWGGTWNDES